MASLLLRQSAACVQLSREQVSDLITITAARLEEHKRIRRILEQLPEGFTEVRDLRNELSSTVR